MEDNFNKNPFFPTPPKKEDGELKDDDILKKDNEFKEDEIKDDVLKKDNDFKEDEIKDDELKKEDESKNETKQRLPFHWTTHEGDNYAPFFESRRIGQRKYEISLNINHIYYDKFTSLDDNGKIVLCSMLYSFILAEESVLYNVIGKIKDSDVDLDHEDKNTIIDKLNREWSDLLKDTLYR
jgi:hypothetical protein